MALYAAKTGKSIRAHIPTIPAIYSYIRTKSSYINSKYSNVVNAETCTCFESWYMTSKEDRDE